MMRHPFQQTSITRKLILIIMSTSGVVLLLATIGFAVYDIVTFRGSMVRDLLVLARVTGENTAAALAFDDSSAASETVYALSAIPSISSACIYSNDGRLFAKYIRNVTTDGCPPTPVHDRGRYFFHGHLTLSARIAFKGDHVGTIYLDEDTRAIDTRIKRYAIIAGAILVASSAVAFFLSHRLQRIVSDPIRQLTETASVVAANKDYSVRLETRSNDELGIMAAAFNEMLAVIQGHADTLDAEVTERKRIEDELRKSLAKEKELADLKSRFVSMASHEFRTPLTTVLAASEGLRQYGGRMTSAQRIERFSKIHTSVKHMTQLLEDVLVLGREESGKVKCTPEPMDLQTLCDDMVREIQATAEDTHRLVVESRYAQAEVMMDPKLLRQILGNLLTNAVKYSPAGGEVKICVNCDESLAEFRITDSGIGIAPEDLERLFEPFHRGENVGQITGSGLGLTILKKAVELHGGTIEVESALGVGTTFIVTVAHGVGIPA